MEDSRRFGARLKELRTQAGLTQRELASRVSIDFSYLSKIENSVMPPPSERVILQLSDVLKADRDELLTLAGKIPADIAEMLKDRETLQLLRSDHIQKKIRTSSKKEVVHLLEDFKNLPKVAKAHKNFARVAAATILVIAITASLWFVAPVTDTAVAANNQGFVYNNKGEFPKAIVSFNKAIELDPGLAIAYNNRGLAYIELGQYEQAIADFDKAIELDSGLQK